MISIIITCLNEQKELNDTIVSLCSTCDPSRVEVIVVDDCSSCRITAPSPFVKVIQNHQRCGVGPSRHIGALHARGEWILLTDAHMRFSAGWLEAAEHVARDYNRNILYNGMMLGLDEGRPYLDQHAGEYYGATFNFYGPDRNNPAKKQWFESVWLDHRPADGADIPSIMGAVYLMNREWFLHLGALRHLRSWGVDEQILSLKTWLAGGKVVFLPELKLGHVFRGPKRRLPYVIPSAHIVYNKMFAIHTCLTPELAQALLSKVTKTSDWHSAINMIRADWHLVEIEKAYNQQIFVRTFSWLQDRFGLTVPL